MKPVRVLIVDDSALVRNIISRGLAEDPAIEVVGAACDPYEARDMIVKLKPNVLTMDVEMPKMSGVEFVRKLMPQYPIPVVMVSSLTREGQRVTIEALEAGALDFIPKPTAQSLVPWSEILASLKVKVKNAAKVDVSAWKGRKSAPNSLLKGHATSSLSFHRDTVIAIGASTGGTEAIKEVLKNIPTNAPGIIVTQHMPAGFTAMFAERLNQLFPLDVKEAETGDIIEPGKVFVAPGDKHLKLVRNGGNLQIVVKEGAKVSGHCPSVDVMFDSVAETIGSKAIGVILTGMGKDGANGLLSIKKAGGRTLGQDEASSIVYGMPKAAMENGSVEKQLALSAIGQATLRAISEIK